MEELDRLVAETNAARDAWIEHTREGVVAWYREDPSQAPPELPKGGGVTTEWLARNRELRAEAQRRDDALVAYLERARQ